MATIAHQRGWLRQLRAVAALLALGAVVAACQPAKESHQMLPTESVATKGTPYSGPKHKLALGAVDNRSPYMRGLFSDGTDRVGIQARQILMSHLTQTNRFVMLDRLNMDELKREASLSGEAQALLGAQYVVTGAVTEFGRRETGTGALGGALGQTRTQTAYAKVSLTLVDVKTSAAVYSAQGAGEFNLDTGHVLGFGSSAGYDATLTDKVLNLAMMDAVNKLVAGLEAHEWGFSQ